MVVLGWYSRYSLDGDLIIALGVGSCLMVFRISCARASRRSSTSSQGV